MELIIVLIYVIACALTTYGISKILKMANQIIKMGIEYEARSYGEFYQKFNIKYAFIYNKKYEKEYKKILKKHDKKQIQHDVRIVNSYLQMIEYSNTIIGYILAGAFIYIAILTNNIIENINAIFRLELQSGMIYQGIVIYIYVALIVTMIRNLRAIKIQHLYVAIATEILHKK